MANELNITVGLEYSKSGINLNKLKSKLVTVSGTEAADFIQSIGTAEEAVALSDMTTQGYVYAENLDNTNYVEIGLTGKLANKLKAGEFGLWRTAGALYAQANTSAVRVRFIVIED